MMLSTTLSFANLHNHGELFANLLRARRESFIVRNRWDLPQTMGMEYDQYDTPASRWLAVHCAESCYTALDFEDPAHHTVEIWASCARFDLFAAETPKERRTKGEPTSIMKTSNVKITY